MTIPATDSMLEIFVRRLQRCERFIDELDDYDQGFVKDMRKKFEERESQMDMSITPWTPSAKQYNYLLSVAEKVG